MEFQKEREPAKKVAKSARVYWFSCFPPRSLQPMGAPQTIWLPAILSAKKEEAPKKKLIFYTAFPIHRWTADVH